MVLLEDYYDYDAPIQWRPTCTSKNGEAPQTAAVFNKKAIMFSATKTQSFFLPPRPSLPVSLTGNAQYDQSSLRFSKSSTVVLFGKSGKHLKERNRTHLRWNSVGCVEFHTEGV